MRNGWSVEPLGKIAEINPTRRSDIRSLDDATEVTFVPMAAVDDVTGTADLTRSRPLGDVRAGFTAFQEDDVIFAKITPCMQNGKAAITRGLKNGLGFGSTEFHVIRPNGRVIPEWIWYFVRQRSFRDDAQKHFRGSAGQQRVPAEFLTEYEIPVPPLTEQHAIASRINECSQRIHEILELNSELEHEVNALHSAMIEDLLPREGKRVRLSEVCSIESSLVDPRLPDFKHLLHIGGANIESATGELLELKAGSDEKLISAKFLFTRETSSTARSDLTLRRLLFPISRDFAPQIFTPFGP